MEIDNTETINDNSFNDEIIRILTKAAEAKAPG